MDGCKRAFLGVPAVFRRAGLGTPRPGPPEAGCRPLSLGRESIATGEPHTSRLGERFQALSFDLRMERTWRREMRTTRKTNTAIIARSLPPRLEAAAARSPGARPRSPATQPAWLSLETPLASGENRQIRLKWRIIADGHTTRIRWHSLALVFQREINRLRGSDILLNMAIGTTSFAPRRVPTCHHTFDRGRCLNRS